MGNIIAVLLIERQLQAVKAQSRCWRHASYQYVLKSCSTHWQAEVFAKLMSSV